MNYFFLFLFSIVFGVNTDEECGKIDGSEGSCIAPVSSSPDEQQQILDEINYIRNEVAAGTFDCGCTSGYCPKAKKMLKLVWSDALASSAQDYLNAKHPYNESHGYYKDGSREGHSNKTHRYASAYNHCSSTSCAAGIQSGDKVGENIYNKYKWSSSNGVITRTIYTISELIDKASQSWDDDEAINMCPGDSYNHFTQDVWDETMYIGCGVGLFNETEKKLRNVIICHYYERGNISPNDPYETTTGSVVCPTGFETDSVYTSLCKSSSSVRSIDTIIDNSNNNKFDLFDPSNYSFIEIVVLILIGIVFIFGIAGCILIYKRRKLKKELENKDLHTELSGEMKKSKNITQEKEEKQNEIQVTYNPEPEKTTFDDLGAQTVKI